MRLRVTELWRTVVLGVIVGSIPAAVLGYTAYALYFWAHTMTLEHGGVTIPATVLARDCSGAVRDTTCVLTVSVPVAGPSRYEFEHEVDEALFARTADTVSLRCDATDVSDCVVSGNLLYLKKLIHAGVAILLLGIALVVAYRLHRQGVVPPA